MKTEVILDPFAAGAMQAAACRIRIVVQPFLKGNVFLSGAYRDVSHANSPSQ
jgi:hypothetical protein